jgi:hypothetical protein
MIEPSRRWWRHVSGRWEPTDPLRRLCSSAFTSSAGRICVIFMARNSSRLQP